MKNLKLALIIVVGLAAVTLGATALWVSLSLTPLAPGSPQSTTVTITRGMPPSQIAQSLKDSGVIADATRFVWVGRVFRRWGKIRSGEYVVSPAQTPLQLFSTLTSGVSVGYPITVREGENMYEIADELDRKKILSGAAFLKLCTDPAFIEKLGLTAQLLGVRPPSLEGYLYPETYQYTRLTTAEELIQKMVKRFMLIWSTIGPEYPQRFGLNLHQVVTLASMVEKETGAGAERTMVSSVFHNRLNKKMRLQSDPTTIYGIWKTYDGNIHRSDLTHPTPYNTYTVAALPIGPISNPGKEALIAALSPAKSNYLFFVSHNDGTHQFSETLTQHNAAVNHFQVDPKAREGKSWRDLKKP